MAATVLALPAWQHCTAKTSNSEPSHAERAAWVPATEDATSVPLTEGC